MLHNKKRLILTAAALLGLAMVGCSGGDTDGGKAADEDFGGTQFVPNGENSGSIVVDVIQTDLPISELSGFTVLVRDSVGAPVPGVRISCDSELGVAIIEPTTGSEITDSGGHISGKIGCAAPGSYQFGCRVPVGGNIRQFVTIKCTGEVPVDFNGFAGAAGGTLGSGGAVTPDNGGPGGTDGDVKISTITMLDQPGATVETVQVDVNQRICTQDDPTTTTVDETVYEPFTDTFVKLKVVNNTNSSIRFTSVTYSVPNADGTGRSFTSTPISFIGETTAAADGGEATLTALAFSITGSGSSDKYLVNSSSGNLGLSALGFRNVRFTVTGTNAQGETVRLSGTIAISFSNYDNC